MDVDDASERRSASLSHLHAQLGRQEGRLDRLEHDIDSLVDGQRKMRDDLLVRLDHVQQAIIDHRTKGFPWQAVWGGASVLLVVIAGFGSGFIRDISRVEIEQGKTQDAVAAHTSDGHPTVAISLLNKLEKETDSRIKALRDDVTEGRASLIRYNREIEKRIGDTEGRLLRLETQVSLR